MTTKSSIITATAGLLAQSHDGEVSTRAVCEAAGVQQPVIYRLFGDKAGLMAATVDHVWDEYLGMKRAAERSEDPLEDLRAGWDSHTAFAIANPNAYRLLFGSGAVNKADSAAEAMRLLRDVLDRLAAEGRLRIDPSEAARLVMAANSGVALALILQPTLYPDLTLSTTMRDVVHSSIVHSSAARKLAECSGAGHSVAAPSLAVAHNHPIGDATEPARIAAITLRSALQGEAAAHFTASEAGLLDEWLERIQAVQG